jgi:Flp pilus assembly protein TadD
MPIMLRTLFFLFVLLPSLLGAQHLTYAEWQWQSARDMRLAPRYDGRQKNPEQLASDSAFVAETLAVIPDRQQASDHLVDLGFEQLREGNMTHAMYRFNQAYLVMPNNPDIYRGYGAFFMALDRSTDAGRQYLEGLAIDSTDTALMTDLASALMTDEHRLKDSDPERAEKSLTGAINVLERVKLLEPTNAEAAFKLSVCYLYKGDCTWAWRERDRCDANGGAPLTPEFEAQLKAKCPR